MCSPYPSFFMEALRNPCGSWLYGTEPGMEFMVRLCLSLSCQYCRCYQCGYFLICLIWKSHTASFWISFRGNCSMCSYTFSASKEGRKFSSLLSHHFSSSLAFLLFFFFFFSQKELEKQKRIKRNQQLEAIAKEHYERVLLRKKGLEPWKRLRMQSMQNLQV